MNVQFPVQMKMWLYKLPGLEYSICGARESSQKWVRGGHTCFTFFMGEVIKD
jgi:hypothetical protein